MTDHPSRIGSLAVAVLVPLAVILGLGPELFAIGQPRSGLSAVKMVAAAASVTKAGITPTSQRQALVDLYHTTSGSRWTSSDRWLNGDPCDDSWKGITCSGTRDKQVQRDIM